MESNAPKKIYLQPSRIEQLPHQNIVYTKPLADNSIEYTRTDAFIENALEFLNGCIPDYIELKHANVDTFMDIDNKRFINDFRNYMKGE